MKIRKIQLVRDLPSKLPESPGIYVYWGKGQKPIYVGKAKNLRSRVSSYFQTRLEIKTSQMMNEAKKFSYIKVPSEIEALLLEVRLIKKYQPRYNIISKDGKRPLFIKITDESYPRILTVRSETELPKAKSLYGPFPSSQNVRSILAILRRTFPFSTHKLGKSPCLYSQIGLCYPCPNEIVNNPDVKTQMANRKIYLTNIKKINYVLSGKIDYLRKFLNKEMNNLASLEKFEEAELVKKQLETIDYITQPTTPVESFELNPNLIDDIRQREIDELSCIVSKRLKKKIKAIRIECYDVAHLAGTHPAASMVTFINAEADKNYYRHFKIRQSKGADDINSMRELAERRLAHLDDWGAPNLIIVDGGRGQVGVFSNSMKFNRIPVIGLEKQFETLVFPLESHSMIKFKNLVVPNGPAKNLLQRIRNEAHRFARRYHHKLLKKSLFG